MKLGIVVGLDQEARIARRWGQVAIGGGTAAGAAEAAAILIASGIDALLSFGLAGGLDPTLRPGTILAASTILTEHAAWPATLTAASLPQAPFWAAATPIATAAAKAALWARTGAACTDLESGAVAHAAQQAGIRFGALRAICDPAERDLPPAALIALHAGAINPWPIAASLLRSPRQLPALLALAQDAAKARVALIALHLDLTDNTAPAHRPAPNNPSLRAVAWPRGNPGPPAH